MSIRKMHLRDRRLFVNAGMRFPACYAAQQLLDTDKSSLPTTNRAEDITCKRCRKLLETAKPKEATR